MRPVPSFAAVLVLAVLTCGMPGLSPTATVSWTALPAGVPIPEGWQVYRDSQQGFQIAYPAGGQVLPPDGATVAIELPIAPGTNLSEKYLDITTAENANSCPGPHGGNGESARNVTVNGMLFVQENGIGVAAGNDYEWTAYTIVHDSVCVNLAFVLHSGDIGNYVNPPAVFDEAAESQVFAVQLSTFSWIKP